MKDIIFAPIITEKSETLKLENKYTFKVNAKANKIEIKRAIEEIFEVEVEKVNVLNTKPKNKNFRTKRIQKEGKTKPFKKAIITLKDGQSIEL